MPQDNSNQDSAGSAVDNNTAADQPRSDSSVPAVQNPDTEMRDAQAPEVQVTAAEENKENTPPIAEM